MSMCLGKTGFTPCITLVGGGRVGGRGLEASSACLKQANMTFLTVGNRAAPPIGANAALELELLTNSTVRG